MLSKRDFMKTNLSGSQFAAVLQDVITELSEVERSKLPVGIVLLEADGTLSAVNVPITAENAADVTSSMFAIEYIMHAFDRTDWMIQYARSLYAKEKKLVARKESEKRKKFKIIQGGKAKAPS